MKHFLRLDVLVFERMIQVAITESPVLSSDWERSSNYPQPTAAVPPKLKEIHTQKILQLSVLLVIHRI